MCDPFLLALGLKAQAGVLQFLKGTWSPANSAGNTSFTKLGM
jgi:hypothetical protein